MPCLTWPLTSRRLLRPRPDRHLRNIRVVHLRNTSDKPVQGTVAVSMPRYEFYEMPKGTGHAHTRQVTGSFAGMIGATGGWEYPLPWGYGYALGGAAARCGQDFNADPTRWNNLGDHEHAPPLRPRAVEDAGASVAVDFALDGGETRVVRYLWAWHAQTWSAKGSCRAGGNQFTHMYADRFADIEAIIDHIVENHESLLKRVLAWQQVVYNERQLGPWLRDSLVNILYMMTETGIWAQAKTPIGDWCKPEDGVFGLNESPRQCPQFECLPCSFYGNLPVVYFFPKLALSTLRAYKAYQFDNGQPPFMWGGYTAKVPVEDGVNGYDLASPNRGYQEALNGCCVVEIVHKLCMRSNDEVLDELYDMCKRATVWQMTLRPEYGDKQVVAMPTGEGKEWFEAPEPQ